MWLHAISNQEYVLNEKTKTLFSALDVLWIIPTNMVAPFMYLVDIIKDSLQLSILLMSIGGIKSMIRNPTSFASIIIVCNFLTIIVPIVVSGTIKQRKAERSTLKRLSMFLGDLVTSVLVHPIKLQYDLVVAKCVREKLLESKLTSLITHFEENESIIKCLEEEKCRHIRLQQGLETIYQLTLNLLLIFYGISTTKTSQGLSALFEPDNNINIIGISMSATLVVTINTVLNFLSFIYVNINGIRGNSWYFPLTSQLILALAITCSCVSRMMSIVLYFSPTLGLFELLQHLKAEQFGFRMLGLYPYFDPPPYIGPVLNMTDISAIQRGHFIDTGDDYDQRYEPPSLELYTFFSKGIYFWMFLSLHFFQIVIIFFINQCLGKIKSSSLWQIFLMSIVQSHFPFPGEDWDAKDGGCIDHIKRKMRAQKEFLVLTLVNLFFNLVQLFPLLILRQTISERHHFLENSIIGVLGMEIEAYDRIQLMTYFIPPIFITLAVLQYLFFFLYNGPLHPSAKILDGTDNTSKDGHPLSAWVRSYHVINQKRSAIFPHWFKTLN